MKKLFLIAHKVYGEPAFDIAEKMECSECHGLGCVECDNLGYWWIISTSGHRAYPWWHLPLAVNKLDEGMRLVMDHNPTHLSWTIFEMPPDLPDHYAHSSAPHKELLAALLAKLPPVVVKQFKRRF